MRFRPSPVLRPPAPQSSQQYDSWPPQGSKIPISLAHVDPRQPAVPRFGGRFIPSALRAHGRMQVMPDLVVQDVPEDRIAYEREPQEPSMWLQDRLCGLDIFRRQGT